ncbi:MAG: hypothetical protein HQK60_00225 [Deltaproteobacteria bacterium]|nr:hypothetical protein [Deltaproteobacteria bacterium]
MPEDELRFPDDWPANCPPADAVDANITAYGHSKENPPGEHDIETFHEMNVPVKPGQDLCQRCGLSVSTTVEDAVEIRRLFPRRKRYIIVADLKPEHGKIKMTEGPVPSHATFWKYSHLTFQEIFRG